MLLKNKINEMKSFIKNSNILASEEECYCYAEDSSNIIKSKKMPDVVVFAETVEDIQNTLKYAYENEIPVISRGAGTNMVGSCVAENGGIILNFSRMNKILETDKTNMTARVQPGVVLGELKNAANEIGLFFPPDPSNYEVSTIGGAIAQSSGGALGLKYGTAKDYVLSLKVVTSNGELITLGSKTSKSSAGYHLTELISGSEGTLAVIAEATLKLIPKPESQMSVFAYFDDIEKGSNAVSKIIDNGILPSAIDFMDKNSIQTVEEYAKCGLNTDMELLLLITSDGDTCSVNNQIEQIKEILQQSGSSDIITSGQKESALIWKARRSSFASTARLAPDVVTDDIIVPRSNFANMVKSCKNIAKKYNLNMCMVGHAGDGNIHPQIALNLENEEEFRRYMNAKAEIYDAAISLGGTISAEHGIGLEKKAYLQKAVDSTALDYMKMIKKVFDPKNILNPGKIF